MSSLSVQGRRRVSLTRFFRSLQLVDGLLDRAQVDAEVRPL